MKKAAILLASATFLFLLPGCSSARSGQSFIQEINGLIKSDAGMSEAFKKVHEAPTDLDPVIIPWIQQNSTSLPAPFLLELGARVFPTDKNEGLKWYMVGRHRASYDGRRCVDQSSAGQAIYTLMMEYQQIPAYFKSHKTDFYTAWQSSLEWDKTHPYTASPVWLCSHSMDAFQKPANELMVPETQWTELRNSYWAESEAKLARQSNEYKTSTSH